MAIVMPSPAFHQNDEWLLNMDKGTGVEMCPETGVSSGQFNRADEPYGLHVVRASVFPWEDATDPSETGV